MIKHTNIISAHVGGLSANAIIRKRRQVCVFTRSNLLPASIGHFVCEFHIVVNSVVDLVCELLIFN